MRAKGSAAGRSGDCTVTAKWSRQISVRRNQPHQPRALPSQHTAKPRLAKSPSREHAPDEGRRTEDRAAGSALDTGLDGDTGTLHRGRNQAGGGGRAGASQGQKDTGVGLRALGGKTRGLAGVKRGAGWVQTQAGGGAGKGKHSRITFRSSQMDRSRVLGGSGHTQPSS